MRVRFVERYGAWWPGADPVIDADLATDLTKRGFCVPFDAPVVAQVPEPEPVVVTDANDNDSEKHDASSEPTGSKVAPKNRQRRSRR